MIKDKLKEILKKNSSQNYNFDEPETELEKIITSLCKAIDEELSKKENIRKIIYLDNTKENREKVRKILDNREKIRKIFDDKEYENVI